MAVICEKSGNVMVAAAVLTAGAAAGETGAVAATWVAARTCWPLTKPVPAAVSTPAAMEPLMHLTPEGRVDAGELVEVFRVEGQKVNEK